MTSFRLFAVDCDKAVQRVAELEKALESQRVDSKKRLEEAEQREIELLQAQKVEVSRLLGLASHVGGTWSSPFVFFVSFCDCIFGS